MVNDIDVKLSEMFKVLSGVTRLRILRVLEQGELSVGEICQKLNMEVSAVSHQLKELKVNNIISNRKDGQTVRYSIYDHHIFDILNLGQDHISGKNCFD